MNHPAPECNTIPKLLLHNAAQLGDSPANREKALGIWQTWTWSQVRKETEQLAGGLAQLGFQRGDKLAIIGDNRPYLYWAMVAAQSLGGVPVPLYQDSVAEEMVYVLSNADIRFAVVENQYRHSAGGIGLADLVLSGARRSNRAVFEFHPEVMQCRAYTAHEW